MFTTELRNYGLGGLLGARTAEGVPERTYVTNESRKWSDDPQLMRGEQPVASTNSVSTYITLAEPVLFLQGWPSSYPISGSAVLLRGVVKIDVAKTTKIRSITLNFKGTSTTKWPEGIPSRKVEAEETTTIMNHTWPFFNAAFPTADASTGADYVSPSRTIALSRKSITSDLFNRHASATAPKPANRRLSLQLNASMKASTKVDESQCDQAVTQKGYRSFCPGEYYYNFELPLDNLLPESIEVDYGSVKYELEATVERAGAFKANLTGVRQVLLVRTQAEGSLEHVEPISISRNWEDKLHYDVVISGKTHTLGSQVPIAFKLTPLEKIQCQRINVYITESCEYTYKAKQVHRLEPSKNICLFEKRADGPFTSTYSGSSMRILSGAGMPHEQRAAAAGGQQVPLSNTSNLLGNLDDTGNVGPTELEVNIQLPDCWTQKKKDKTERLSHNISYSTLCVKHWIKIVLRLSKQDERNPGRTRLFDISIDSPITILSCRANLAATALPAYSSIDSAASIYQHYECGCPDSPYHVNRKNTVLSAPEDEEAFAEAGTTRPHQVHVSGVDTHSLQRPIHFLRAPSYLPPAFDEDSAPPPAAFLPPPPEYNDIASPNSGLADYYSRVSTTYDLAESETTLGRSRSRIDVPLTPGGRVSRSMDEPRSPRDGIP